MKKYFIHNPVFRILAPAVYGVLIYLLILLINNNVTQLNEFFSSGELYTSIALTYLSFESMRITIVLLKKYLVEKYLFLRIPIQFILTSAISTSVVLTAVSLYFTYVVGFSIATSQLILFFVLYVFTSLLYNILYFSHEYLHRENTLKLTAEKQQREVLEMEMTEFNSDINPDLLYESLETVISLMNLKKDKAEEYIDYLASAYRYILTNRHRELISLHTEIEAGKNVIGLLNERFFNQITFESSLSEHELSRHVIPGSLPVVVEYIVRNTIISSLNPLQIKCYTEDDEYLVIQSTLNDRLIQHTESSVALNRLKKSYSLYSDRPLIQVKAYDENYIKLPMLKVTEETQPLHT
jgi:hypothetical protein